MGDCPDYPESQRFLPFIPGSVILDSEYIHDFDHIFEDNDDEWIPPENYFLLKYSLKYVQNNTILFITVSAKLEELCYARILFRRTGYFSPDRCEKQLHYLLEVTNDDESIQKTDKGKYCIRTHIKSILDDLIIEDSKFRKEFFEDPENFKRLLKLFKGTFTDDEADLIFETLGQYSLIIIDMEPEDANLISKAIKLCTKEELNSIRDVEGYRQMIKQKVNFLKKTSVVNDMRMREDEQLINLWSNLENQTVDANEWPKPPKAPELPRTTSLSPREHDSESLPSVLPPPPTMPPSDATLPQMIIPPPPAEPMEIDIPSIEPPSAPSTPINKDINNDLVVTDTKKMRGRPKKTLTLDIPPAKKIKTQSREPSETPRATPVIETPESEGSPSLSKSIGVPSKISSSVSTPELGTMSRSKNNRTKDDMPMREARKRQQSFYTPTNSPRAESPTRPSEDRNIEEITQEAIKIATARPPSSLPQSALSSACPSTRSSEERKPDVRSRKNTPLLRGDTKKVMTATVETQTFIIIPNIIDPIPEGLVDDNSIKMKVYTKKEQQDDSTTTKTVGTQTGPIGLHPETRLMRWLDPVLKTNFLAKQIVRASYSPSSRYIRDKTCKIQFNVERRSVIDLPNPLRSHKNYDRVQKISKLGLDEIYVLPARFSQLRYRRMITKPMDQQTIKELMAQGQLKGSLDLTLNAVLMCANNVVFNGARNDLKATKDAEQNTLNVIDILRNPKD